MFVSRLFSSITLLLLLILIFNSIFFSKLLLFHALSSLTLWEYFRLLKIKKYKYSISKSEELNNILLTRIRINVFEYFIIFLLQLVLFLFYKNFITETLYFLFIFLFFGLNFIYKDFLFFFGLLYLLAPFFFLNYLSELELNFILALVFIVTISSDSGGYIFGKIFKGPKLIKSISPNKTWSGFLGAILLSILCTFFYLSHDDKHTFILLIILFSIGCQSGDIIESYIKRKIKIKNSGSSIPGHGGILDRLDSFYFLTNLIMIFYFFDFNLFEIFDFNFLK